MSRVWHGRDLRARESKTLEETTPDSPLPTSHRVYTIPPPSFHPSHCVYTIPSSIHLSIQQTIHQEPQMSQTHGRCCSAKASQMVAVAVKGVRDGRGESSSHGRHRCPPRLSH